ncbi:hypothetical protein ACH4A8_27420 [Streptomyces vietnamensis]|uniref:hypothetical protein n=1 Tax=Streptomyces vietnamensis TaxID=362257 RepID=UPI00379D95D8
MTAQSPPQLTTEAARKLQSLLRTAIGPGLTERELDAVGTRFGFTFAADHRVFLSAGLPHGSPEWHDACSPGPGRRPRGDLTGGRRGCRQGR